MSTHINGIVQVTRKMNAVDASHRDVSETEAAEFTRLSAERMELILTALRDGVDADLIQWAIGVNNSPAKIQIQHAIGHLAAAAALEG